MDKEKKLALMNENSSGFNRHNGIVISDFSDGFCVVEGELTPEAKNPMGTAHGGFIYSLCDVAAGVAVRLAGKPGVTLGSDVHFLHPSRGARLRCEGRIVKDGRNIVVVDTCVFDENGTMTAKGIFEMFITPQEEEKP